MSRNSPSRLGQVLSGITGSIVLQPHAQEGADSLAPPAAQAPTDISAAGVVIDNPPASEEVGSAGAAPQVPLGEFVGDSLAAGFQGETSGLHDGGTAGGSTYGFGESRPGGAFSADAQQPGTASVQAGGSRVALQAGSHHASRAEAAEGGAASVAAGGGASLARSHRQQQQQPQPSHPAKRKMSEMGEVEFGDARGAPEHKAAAGQVSSGSAGEGGATTGGAAFNRVPSDVAMVVGDALGPPPQLEEVAGGGGLGADLLDSAGMLPDDVDSNMARAIQASLDEARAQQQRQQQQQQQGGGGEAAAGEGVEDSGAAAGGGGLHDRPSDADIIAWENAIKETEVKTVPLMGDREPLGALAAEYAAGSSIYQQKIEKLGETYGSIRRTRGDGNCFFRSFLFGYLEGLLLTGDGGAERDRALGVLEDMKKVLSEVGGYDEIVLETPMDVVLQMLRNVGAPLEPLTIEGLESNIRDEDISAYAVWMLRMITSTEIKRRADFFEPFIMGLSDLDVASFCSKHVDPMGEESDHVQLVALTDALQVPIRVVYLDRSLAPGGGGNGGDSSVHVDLHDFVPEGCPQPAKPRVHLLYRPGHYDLLYPKHDD